MQKNAICRYLPGFACLSGRKLAPGCRFRYNGGVGERNTRMQAIILSVRKTGESNSLVTMLTDREGLCTGMLYGGPKSRLRSLVQQFNSGTVWLYEDKARQSAKITDYAVSAVHERLKASLPKIWAASLAAEIVLKTQAAGDAEAAFTLLSAFLDGTDATDENGTRLGTIRFLWRYLGLLGVQPPIEDCRGRFQLNGEAAAYLEALNSRSPGEVRKLLLDAQSVFQLKNLTFSLIEEAAGRQLNTIACGFSML